MQGEGKRPSSQPPLHEQLSPPAGIHPLSTTHSSLTTPLPLKKKKLLKVILKSPPTPNPNRFSPSLSSSPSSPPPPSPSSLSTTLLPPHHHHLQQHQLHHHQQHQLHHHQQLLLQQQHLHKQKLLQQQTQQLASELQLKLHQQLLLQQEHPKLLEQFKQQLQQEQIYDLQGNSWQTTSSNDIRSNLKGQSFEEERPEFPGKGRSTHERKRNASSSRRRGRSRELSCDALSEEQCVLGKSRFHPGEEANLGHSLQEDVQEPLEECFPNGQKQPIWQRQENLYEEGEPTSKRLKLSEQHIEGNPDARNSLRSPTGKRNKVPDNGPPHGQKPLANGLLTPSRFASVSAPVDLSEASWFSKRQGLVDSTLSEVPHTLAKPVSEGSRHNGGTATTPPSKNLGGSGNASVPGRKLLRGILDKLQKKDSYGAFSEPVDPNEVPDYYDVIKEPMDFGTMRKRISSGFYTNLGVFEKDIFAICSNATTFNAVGTVYHRQARAIKAAAERILEPLKAPGATGADEGSLKQKVVGPQVKKSHKKKQPWMTDVSEPMSNRSVGGRASVSYLADSYYVDWQAGSGQTSNKINTDDKEDAMGFSAKSLGLYEGRRFVLNEESRRSTYRRMSNFGSGSLVATVGGGPLQFVPAGFQLDFSYARSLARFAADLGPDVWKVAREKIRRALPPGVPFGPGWVGQRESPARACPLPNRPLMPAICSMDQQGKAENVSNEIAGADDTHRKGNSFVLEEGAFGATSASDQVPSAIDHRVNQIYIEERRSGEFTHMPQVESQAPLEAGVRQAPPLCNRDGESLQQTGNSSFPLQQGDRETDLLRHCDGDVVLIPGRDLGGAGCVDYQGTHPSLLHFNSGSMLISAPISLIEGIQPRLSEDG